MNKINDIRNEEFKKGSEVTESHFDDKGHKELIDKIERKKSEQKEHDLAQVSELTEVLLEDKKMPINYSIDNLRKDGLNEEEIAKKLIIQGYSWDEFMNSSIDNGIKKGVENLYYTCAFRFNDKEDFYNKFCDIIKEASSKGEEFIDVVKNIPLKRAVTMEDIKYLKKTIQNPSAHVRIVLSGEILPDFDWSKSREVFNYLRFDDKTFSKTSKEHLPEGYNPKEVFERGKSIGLGIDDVHKMGYTGKGISVAICDWQLKPHKDISTKEYIVEEHAGNTPEYFHASAVSSILAGKQTGIAPDSDLYFFAEKENFGEKNGGSDLKSAFTKILKKNEKLPDNKKIRVISISGPLYGGKETEKLVKKLEDSGVWVFHSGEFWKDFGYLEKKDPMGDTNDFDNYQHYLGEYRHFLRKSEALFVNSGDRTVIDPRDNNAYRHDSQACASWAIPVVAGYYVLACQADPTITPKKFKELARETAHEINSTIRNEKNGEIKRSKGTRKIKIIDIKALIQKIEEEKNKQYYISKLKIAI